MIGRAKDWSRVRQRRPQAEVSNQQPSINLKRLDEQKSEVTRPGKSVSYWLKRLVGAVVFGFIIISLANILSLSDIASVRSAGGSNAFLRPLATYNQAANHYLDSSIWNKNKVTLSSSGLENKLKQQFPELSSVSVAIPLISHQPVVYVAAYQPTLILRSISGQFAISDQGVALRQVTGQLDSRFATLPEVTEANNQTIKLNQAALASTSVSFIQEVSQQLKAKGYRLTGLSLPASTSELDAQIDSVPYEVKFNLQSNDPKGEAGTLLATLTYLKHNNVTPAQYIDVRLSGRAYYK